MSVRGVFGTTEAAKFFGCTDSNIRRQIAAGVIEATRFGTGTGSWQIPRRELVRLTDDDTVTRFEQDLAAEMAA